MRIDRLDFDDANENHIAMHGVRSSEVEEVCAGRQFARKGEGGKYIISGRSRNGRYLTVVLQRISGAAFRPVTAFDMSESQKRRYRKLIRK